MCQSFHFAGMTVAFFNHNVIYSLVPFKTHPHPPPPFNGIHSENVLNQFSAQFELSVFGFVTISTQYRIYRATYSHFTHIYDLVIYTMRILLSTVVFIDFYPEHFISSVLT